MNIKAIVIVAAAVLLLSAGAAIYFGPAVAGMVCNAWGCGARATASSPSGALYSKEAAGCAGSVDGATVTGGGYCSKLNACSVDRNLNDASGAELARYRQESSTDGKTFEDWIAPAFELPNTAGETVTLADYRGTNVALVFLSGHCYHSLDTLAILADLQDEYSDRNVEILPVFINSGSVEDLRSRAWEWEVEYPLIVSDDKGISRDYDSRMVPATFLIDEHGKVTKKLVGFKDLGALDDALGQLIRS